MAQNQRGLGRGFDSLIPTDLIQEEFDPTAKPTQKGAAGEVIQQIELSLIDPNPHQPRQMFDETQMEGLASSIRLHGILQPLVATKQGGRYELIAGERRLRAAKLAGLSVVPVIVRTFDEQQKLELALLENLQRADLNAIETATAYRKLIDQFNLTVNELARRLGKDASTISNTMRLLNLPLEAKRAVATGKLSETTARVILSIPDKQKQLAFLELLLKHDWTTRQAEEFARTFKQEDQTAEKALRRIQPQNEMTEELSRYLGTKVTQTTTAKGGKLIIEYYSDEELDRIFQAIRREQE